MASINCFNIDCDIFKFLNSGEKNVFVFGIDKANCHVISVKDSISATIKFSIEILITFYEHHVKQIS